MSIFEGFALGIAIGLIILFLRGISSKEIDISAVKPKLEFGAPITGINYKVIDRELKIVHWFCYEDKESMKDLLRSYRYGACDIDVQVLRIDEDGGIEQIG